MESVAFAGRSVTNIATKSAAATNTRPVYLHPPANPAQSPAASVAFLVASPPARYHVSTIPAATAAKNSIVFSTYARQPRYAIHGVVPASATPRIRGQPA